MNLAALLVAAARRYPDRPALAIGEAVIARYEELALRVARLACGLGLRFALNPGDRVALAMRNSPAFAETLLACWHAGLIAVPINAKLHPREFAYILENSGAGLCVASAELVSGIAAAAPRSLVIDADGRDYAALFAADAMAPAEVRPDDPAWLFYTSGTTGRPKGATLTHRNMLALTLSYFADIDTIGPQDAIVHAAPMSHGSGLYIPPHIAKAALHVIPESGGFEPEEFARLLRHHKSATVFFAPTMVQRLIAHPGFRASDTMGLKTLVYGGGPMYVADTLRALDAFGPRLVQIYGQGESPMTITALSRADHADKHQPLYLDRLASVGLARTGVEVRVVDAADRNVPVGEIGEIAVRGDIVMAGYWRNPDASAETLRGGWLHTGDLGAFDADGFLTLKDRSKDVIISGGANIYPREVEEVLLEHHAVVEAAVVGRPHSEWGEEVVAFVVARPGAAVTEQALESLCLARIARFKRPRVWRFVAELPKNNYGKVLKTELRKLL